MPHSRSKGLSPLAHSCSVDAVNLWIWPLKKVERGGVARVMSCREKGRDRKAFNEETEKSRVKVTEG